MAEKEYVERGAVLSLKQKIGAYGMDISSAEVKGIPAADVVEVVRCKDCKHWKQVTAERHACCMTGFEMDYDEYCSYGERENDGT